MFTRFSFRQLEYFVAVGDSGSIAEASERINVSSPAISAAIAHLEEEFGVQLFVRQHAQGLSLTPGGQRFLRRAKVLLDQAGSLHELASDIAEKVSGPISIGSLVTLAPLVMPELVGSFQSLYPDARVTLIEAHQGELITKMQRAEIDVCITYDLELPQDVSFEALAQLPPYAIFARDHPLAQRTSVDLETLAEQPYVFLDLPLSREYFLSLFQTRGLRPAIAARTPSMPMVRSLVANGFGYGLVNLRSRNPKAPDGKEVVYVPLEGNDRPMEIGIAAMKSERHSRIHTAFEDHCRQAISNEEIPGMSLS